VERKSLWTVVSNPFSKNGKKHVRVRCECGDEGERRLDHVKNLRTVSCKSCSCKRTAQTYGTPDGLKKTYYGKISGTKLCSIRSGAMRRGIIFDVDPLLLSDMFTGFCELTGWEIDLEDGTASLDRIDSSQGYIANNIQWLHKDINRLKNNYSQKFFIEMCEAVVKNSD